MLLSENQIREMILNTTGSMPKLRPFIAHVSKEQSQTQASISPGASILFEQNPPTNRLFYGKVTLGGGYITQSDEFFVHVSPNDTKAKMRLSDGGAVGLAFPTFEGFFAYLKPCTNFNNSTTDWSGFTHANDLQIQFIGYEIWI